MYKVMVALRYMRRNWLNLVGVLAIAISVLVLIVVLSVMKGFDEEFRARIRATLSDLTIENWTDEPFSDYEKLMAQIERIPHVVACAPRYESLALIRLGKHRKYGDFIGIDLPRELKTTDFAGYWRAWRGKTARDELTTIFAQGEVGISATPKERVVDLLKLLRHEDLRLLDRPVRQRIELWAQANSVSLDSAFASAESATPEWGDVQDPKFSPSFAGSELLVLGQDEDGAPVALGVGDEVTIISATDIYEGRTFKRCRVTGEFRSGMSDYDARTICLPLAEVQRFMDSEGKVTSIAIRLDSFDNAEIVRAMMMGILTPQELRLAADRIRALGGGSTPEFSKIQADLKRLSANEVNWFATADYRIIQVTHALELDIYSALAKLQKARSANASGDGDNFTPAGDFRKLVLEREAARVGAGGKTALRVSTWEDKRRPFLRAIALERHIMAIILLFVMLVAGFLILSIVHTTVMSKIRDIGILKSIGGSVGGIMSIFLLNGLLMGGIGCALGVSGAALITNNINEIQAVMERMVGFSLFPKDIYYLDRIPVDQHPFWSTVAICLSAVFVSLLAAAYPAWKASRMNAVEALRYE